jgi:o-succinylbenzoate synthase
VISGIRSLRWRPFRLSMSGRFEAASGSLDHRHGVLVELIDEGGRRGVGEASPMAQIDGGNAAHVLALLEQHGAALLEDGGASAEGPGAVALRCALDIAELDLLAQGAGQPVAWLLGKDPAPWVSVNAIIGGGEPEEVAGFGREAMESGYSVLKLKVGVTSLDEDIARVAALREACPEATIRLDANGAWDEETTRHAFEGLYPHRIELLEQPVAAADVEALARVREAAPMRIAADESVDSPECLARVLELHAADYVVLKPMFLGGLRPAMAIAERAAERGIGAFATTTFDSSIGIAAALQLAAALPTDAAHGLATGEHLAADVVTSTLRPRAGRMALPSSAGLGVEPEAAALDAIATAPWSEVAVSG